MHPDWIVPEWPAPAGVQAVCTTRAGGRSSGTYASLNLGDHVGDDPLAVGANRAVLAQSLRSRPVFLQQVHGSQVVQLDANTAHGTQADACVARTPEAACTIMVADCLPLLLTDTQGSFVAAAHAGWRGLAGQGGTGVLEALVAQLKASDAEPELQAARTLVWLGPCIGPQAFEVGAEVKAAFEAQDTRAASCFTSAPGGKWLADLPALARQRLRALGITAIYGNDGSPQWCTAGNPSQFFSHRRDRVSGRMAASICLG